MTGLINQLESFGTVDGPGIRFVVFFQGCPLRCQFCHNPDTWSADLGNVKNNGKGSGEFTPEQLLAEVLRYKNFIRTGGVTATGGEPLMQAEFLCEFFRICKEEGIHTCLDTSGAIFNERTKAVMDYTDLVMLDLKTLDDNLHKSYTGATRENNHCWMEYLQEIGKPTWIRQRGATAGCYRLYLALQLHRTCGVAELSYYGRSKIQEAEYPLPAGRNSTLTIRPTGGNQGDVSQKAEH